MTKPHATNEDNDFVYSYNGITPDGRPVSISPLKLSVWCMILHPEYLDDDHMLKVRSIVLGKDDGREDQVGAVLVTIDPKNGVTKYSQSARMAAEEWKEKDPQISARFILLAEKFEEGGYDSVPLSEYEDGDHQIVDEVKEVTEALVPKKLDSFV